VFSGHGPQAADGTVAGPFGQVGTDVTAEQAYVSARVTGLAILGSLRRELGDLDRIAGWTRLFGMVNSAPGFGNQPAVINGCSDLILEASARTSVPTRGARSEWPRCRSASPSRSRVRSPSGIDVRTAASTAPNPIVVSARWGAFPSSRASPRASP
jgi:hypothetical protein